MPIYMGMPDIIDMVRIYSIRSAYPPADPTTMFQVLFATSEMATKHKTVFTLLAQ